MCRGVPHQLNLPVDDEVRSNFRRRGHGHPQYVYYAEDTPTREHGEMFDQCTVQDVWVANMGTKSSEWKVTFNVRGKKLTLDIDSGATSC